jgi:hypothetical protein
MLALSPSESPDGLPGPWDDGSFSDVAPPLTWRQWLEMLKPDTPAQHRMSYDGWSTKPRSG